MNPLQIGMVLHGYCNGYFGRDSYECNRVEAVGADWVVVRGLESQRPDMAYIEDVGQIGQRLPEWLAPTENCECR